MTTGATGTVLAEVANERAAQDVKWGGSAHDDTHTTYAFLQFIEDRRGMAMYADSIDDRALARRRLIQVAALAVAAIESLDRKTP
jgi:hypothetical protein